MADQVVTSKQFTLNTRDVIRGFILAVIGAVLTAILNSLSSGTLTFNWKQIGIVAATTGVSYLLKNFFEPATIVTPVPSETDQS